MAPLPSRSTAGDEDAMPDVENQLAHLMHAVDAVVPVEDLEARLATGRPLRVKFGVDPTAPDVTLGWAVVFDLLRRFQELGHIAVLIVGDFTARVGDPSGRSETRVRLTAQQVAEYAESCLTMLRPLLLEDRLEIRYNSEWLAAMGMAEVLELTAKMTVAQLTEREDFASRLAAGVPLSMIELMYPLLQGYDSVAVEADVELGGADQLLNLLVGRDIQRAYGQEPQIAMTVPLLVGTDGSRKMSQSYGNYISVRDPAAEMFGKVMSIPDHAMADYFLLAAFVPAAELVAITSGLDDGSLDPAETKRRLGRLVVARHWGEEAAASAEEAFDRVFKEGQAPEEVQEFALPDDDPVWLPGLLKEAGLVPSSSQGRRLIGQGAVRIDGEPLEHEEVGRAALANAVVKVGKRRFVRFVG